MRISLLSDNTKCQPYAVSSMEKLSEAITKGFGWSPGIFKDNYRNLENFQEMHVIALDFDEGMSLEEAQLVFSGYQHVIATSRNHRKEKVLPSGKTKPACDRFRVVLRLSFPIKDDDTYKATFNHLRTLFPAADSVCSDASRFFYPCQEVIQGDNEGITVHPMDPPPKVDKPKRELSAEERGMLARSTLEFITVGAVGAKGRHATLFKAAKDLQEQGFDEPDALELLLRCPLVDEPGLPARDFEKAVRSAFKREPKYEPRGIEEPQGANRPGLDNGEGDNGNSGNAAPKSNIESLYSVQLLEEALKHLANPEAVKGTSTGWKELDDVLGGLRQAELGILQAYPKSGKTVFLTNLMTNLTAQGHKVGFASLEMHPAQQVEPDLYSLLLKKDVRKGIDDADKNRIIELLQQGRGFTYFKRVRRPTVEEICDWIRACHREHGIRFFFVDHFHKFVTDESSVAAISRTITALTGLKYECPEIFVALIVQPTKEQRSREGLSERVGKNTLRGGASIFDECDWLINLHTKYETTRETETTWGWKKERFMASYPNDIREIEFEAIRAKPHSKNMGKKLFMKYNEATTEMKPFKWIAPEPERTYLPDREDDDHGPRRGQGYGRPREQSGWAQDTWKKKKVY